MSETLYKVLNGDGTPFHGGRGRWSLPRADGPGEWMPPIEDELAPCENGYHLCSLDQALDWAGPALFRAEYKGEIVREQDKSVVRCARLLYRVEGWNDRNLRLFACDCAERVLSRLDRPDPRCVEAVRVARLFANGEATWSAMAAARTQLWNAWYAWYTVWDSAHHAARATAWYSAAEAVDRGAERRWQMARLREYLGEGE